jgi:hypothetical protein
MQRKERVLEKGVGDYCTWDISPDYWEAKVCDDIRAM